MTYLQLVNAVLTQLRETTVATVSQSTYSALIGTLVNQAKEEVEDSWNWGCLRGSIAVTTTASTGTYSLTGSSQRTRIQDAWNTTKKGWLSPRGNNLEINANLQTIGTSLSSPTTYDITGTDASDQLEVRVWPIPDGTETLTFYVVNPQATLSSDSTVLAIPSMPVILGAYLRAINERGEDQGRLSEIQQGLYTTSLQTAIAQDAIKFDDETTWLAI